MLLPCLSSILDVVLQAGESNWLQGLLLVVAYCVVSASYFVHEDAE